MSLYKQSMIDFSFYRCKVLCLNTVLNRKDVGDGIKPSDHTVHES